MSGRTFTFSGGDIGAWRVTETETVVGEPLAHVARLDVTGGLVPALPPTATWMLQGIRSNERYIIREEQEQLTAKQPALDRPEATWAATHPDQ